ncbi:MAG: hypothetical protein WD534_14240 [Phycisphaeraceae bacterium]
MPIRQSFCYPSFLGDGVDLATLFREPGQSDAEAVEVCAAGLERAVPYAERHGINLNVELLNSRVDHPATRATTQTGACACAGRLIDRVSNCSTTFTTCRSWKATSCTTRFFFCQG